MTKAELKTLEQISCNIQYCEATLTAVINKLNAGTLSPHITQKELTVLKSKLKEQNKSIETLIER